MKFLRILSISFFVSFFCAPSGFALDTAQQMYLPSPNFVGRSKSGDHLLFFHNVRGPMDGLLYMGRLDGMRSAAVRTKSINLGNESWWELTGKLDGRDFKARTPAHRTSSWASFKFLDSSDRPQTFRPVSQQLHTPIALFESEEGGNYWYLETLFMQWAIDSGMGDHNFWAWTGKAGEMHRVKVKNIGYNSNYETNVHTHQIAFEDGGVLVYPHFEASEYKPSIPIEYLPSSSAIPQKLKLISADLATLKRLGLPTKDVELALSLPHPLRCETELFYK